MGHQTHCLTVVHVITTLDRGGAEKGLLELVREQVNNGYQSIIVPLKGNNDLEMEFRSLGALIDNKLLNRSFLSQIFQTRFAAWRDSSIVHAHLPRAEILLRLSLMKGFIVTRHNEEPFFPQAPIKLSSLLSRFVLKNAFAVISISRSVQNAIIRRDECPKTVFSRVIYYGYRRTLVKIEPPRSKIQRDGRVMRIGVIARLVTQKNITFFIDCIFELKKIGLPVLGLVVGDGPLKKYLTGYIARLSMSHEIKLLGKTEKPLEFLASLDYMLLTSNYEGLGLVLLEAMDVGTNILAPNVSAIPEVLGVDHPGLFEPNSIGSFLSKFQSLNGDSRLRQAVKEEQFQRLSFFSSHSNFSEHHAIYLEATRKSFF